VWQQVHETEAARRRAWEHAASATRQRQAASRQQARAAFQLGLLVIFVLPGLASSAIFLVFQVAEFIASLTEEYELWAVLLIGALVAIPAAVVLVGSFAVLIGMWRLLTRHRRRRKARGGLDRDWFDGDRSAGAVCGVCGAPIAFRVGEHSVQCGFCRSVVVASSEQSERLISFALAESQVAELEHAKAERARLRSEVTLKERQTAMQVYITLGSMACLALPVLAALYAFRTLTPSLEQRLVQRCQQMHGEFGAGADPAFDWLNRYWLGGTPEGVASNRAFQSRWSIETVFHDRPCLLTVTTDWSDRVASRAVLLLARPRRRTRDLSKTLAAARIRALGFAFVADYPGVVLEAQQVGLHQFDIKTLTTLATAAYELAEER
jgi:hypothetical protein